MWYNWFQYNWYLFLTFQLYLILFKVLLESVLMAVSFFLVKRVDLQKTIYITLLQGNICSDNTQVICYQWVSCPNVWCCKWKFQKPSAPTHSKVMEIPHYVRSLPRSPPSTFFKGAKKLYSSHYLYVVIIFHLFLWEASLSFFYVLRVFYFLISISLSFKQYSFQNVKLFSSK